MARVQRRKRRLVFEAKDAPVLVRYFQACQPAVEQPSPKRAPRRVAVKSA